MKKYGRTFHLPQSPGALSDDKVMDRIDALLAADEVVITEKMDGENTTIHASGTHARSPDSGAHVSRDWMKAFAAGIAPQLRPGERIVGEYLYARHAIGYDALPSYFLGFAWIVGSDLLDGVIAELDSETQEGFVVRSTAAFPETAMPAHMGKYVRAAQSRRTRTPRSGSAGCTSPAGPISGCISPVRTRAGLDLAAIGGDGEIGDGRILGLARPVRHHAGQSGPLGDLDGFERLGQGADLVDLDQKRVRRTAPRSPGAAASGWSRTGRRRPVGSARPGSRSAAQPSQSSSAQPSSIEKIG
jgi:hypothetical protein